MTMKVKSKDLQEGAFVRTFSAFRLNNESPDKLVVRVERGADTVERMKAEIAKTTGRAALTVLAQTLLRALEALTNEGREVRLVWFHGEKFIYSYPSQETVTHVRMATVTERKQLGIIN